MKKALITLAVLGTFAGMASAQSSITVFGVVDVNGRYVKNGDVDTKQLANDGNSSSRLGFRGIEDLGNGLKAGFWLESSLAADTGTINSSGKFWHRRSTVSLISNNYGEVRLGRDTVPTWTAFADNDVFGTVGIADASRTFGVLGSNADTKLRADNLASYFLPSNLGGIYGNVSVAPGEGVAGKKYSGGRIGYRAGPMDGPEVLHRSTIDPVARKAGAGQACRHQLDRTVVVRSDRAAGDQALRQIERLFVNGR